MLNQNVSELNTSMRALLSHPSMAEIDSTIATSKSTPMPSWQPSHQFPQIKAKGEDDGQL